MASWTPNPTEVRSIRTVPASHTRCVAQPGRAPASGAGSRGSKSSHTDHFFRASVVQRQGRCLPSSRRGFDPRHSLHSFYDLLAERPMRLIATQDSPGSTPGQVSTARVAQRQSTPLRARPRIVPVRGLQKLHLFDTEARPRAPVAQPAQSSRLVSGRSLVESSRGLQAGHLIRRWRKADAPGSNPGGARAPCGGRARLPDQKTIQPHTAQ